MEVYRIIESVVSHNGLTKLYTLDKKHFFWIFTYWERIKDIKKNNYQDAEDSFYKENYKNYMMISKIGSYYYCYTEADLELVKKAETKVLTEKAKVIGISTQPNFYKQIPNYLMDEIAIKTIARSNPFVLILEKGKVVEKLGAKDYLDK